VTTTASRSSWRRARLAELCAIYKRCGRTQKETAAILGISRSYVSELLLDPTGALAKARKDSYRQPCPECGTLMDGSNGRKGPRLCQGCTVPPAPPNKGKGHAQLAVIGLLTYGDRRFSEIRNILGWTNGMASQELHRMRKMGLIRRVERGVYSLPDGDG